MPDEMLSDMKFQERLIELSKDPIELLKFIAWEQRTLNKIAHSNRGRICSLENRDNKLLGMVGGIGAILGAGIAAFIDYLMRRA